MMQITTAVDSQQDALNASALFAAIADAWPTDGAAEVSQPGARQRRTRAPTVSGSDTKQAPAPASVPAKGDPVAAYVQAGGAMPDAPAADAPAAVAATAAADPAPVATPAVAADAPAAVATPVAATPVAATAAPVTPAPALAISREAAMEEVKAYAVDGHAIWLRDTLAKHGAARLSALTDSQLADAMADARNLQAMS